VRFIPEKLFGLIFMFVEPGPAILAVTAVVQPRKMGVELMKNGSSRLAMSSLYKWVWKALLLQVQVLLNDTVTNEVVT
jgi:hypothetical protein